MELSLLIAAISGSVTVLSFILKVLASINKKLFLLTQMHQDVRDLKTQDRVINKQLNHHEVFLIRHHPEYMPFFSESSSESK